MSLEDLEKRIQAIEDLEEIKKLHQKYIDLMDELRYEEVLDLFTDDATAEVRSSGVKRGIKELREAYIDGLAKVRGKNRTEAHLAIEPNITVNGDTAEGTWLIYMFFSKPTIEWVQGKNEAKYQKVDGTWKIKSMKFTRTNASKPDMFP